MAIILLYLSHFFSLLVCLICFLKKPQHYYIKHCFVYTLTALLFYILLINAGKFLKLYNLSETYRTIIPPLTTIYHLQFFFIVFSDFPKKIIGHSNYLRMILSFFQLFIIAYDLFNHTIIFSYLFTNILISVFSIYYLFEYSKINSFRMFENPSTIIITGFLVLSSVFIPFSIFYSLSVADISFQWTLDKTHRLILLILNVTTFEIFYILLTLACFKYYKNCKKERNV